MKKIAAKEFCDFIPPRNVGFHVELASYLREKLESNQFSTGDCFPSLREMAAYWNTNPYSVKLAINELVLQGYLTRSQGHGTFVAPNVVTLPGLVFISIIPCGRMATLCTLTCLLRWLNRN